MFIRLITYGPPKAINISYLPRKTMKLLGALFLIALTGCSTLIPLITGATIAECDALSTESLRDTCYAKIGILRQDVHLCDRAGDSGSKFYCYEGIAESKNSSLLCSEIEDSYWRNICFKQVGMNIDDYVLCSQITNPELKNSCTLDVAFDTENESICQGIQDSTPLTERCFTKVAVAKLDLSICRNLPPPFAQDRCALKVIYAVGNPSMCNFVLVDGIKEICFERAKEIADARRANATIV